MGTSKLFVSMETYEVRPRKDKRGVDLISDALPFGRLWYGEPNVISNAVDYAKIELRAKPSQIELQTATDERYFHIWKRSEAIFASSAPCAGFLFNREKLLIQRQSVLCAAIAERKVGLTECTFTNFARVKIIAGSI